MCLSIAVDRPGDVLAIGDAGRLADLVGYCRCQAELWASSNLAGRPTDRWTTRADELEALISLVAELTAERDKLIWYARKFAVRPSALSGLYQVQGTTESVLGEDIGDAIRRAAGLAPAPAPSTSTGEPAATRGEG